MKSLEKYKITYGALEKGEHFFHFDINNSFFLNFENSEITVAKIKIDVRLEKKSHLISLNFAVTGTVEVECDRCLELFNLAVSGNYNLYLKFGDAVEDDNDETIFVTEMETEINLSQYLYEYINLSIPLKRVHPEKKGKSTCNQKMIETIDKYSLKNNEEPIDNRWDELRKLLN